MENCVLTTTLPEKSGNFDPELRISPSSQLSIWLLDTKTEISRHIGDTWKFAPQRTKKLATISMDNLAGHTTQFKCPSNEFSTFELACSVTASDCSVSFWQDQRLRPAAGFYFMQHQSVPSL
ncbi:hypothetical protein BJ165DRAFT_1475696 [Panaeolus papilionaceus]|nr:hypothetical protein BJ165DRAFT_1475696 [Panaeolus papilionaceus]